MRLPQVLRPVRLRTVIPPALLTSMAQRARARITDVSAGHMSLISRPGAVTRVIIKAARATS